METENYKEILSKQCRRTMPWKFSTGGCKMDMKLVLTRSLSIQGYILGRATNRVDVFCV